jgi:hypothetical protein
VADSIPARTDDSPQPADPSGSASATYAKINSATVRYVIVRACTDCGGPRQQGMACQHCGNPEPPSTNNLGVVSATYRNPLRWLARHLVGGPLAKRRIKRANRQTMELRSAETDR